MQFNLKDIDRRALTAAVKAPQTWYENLKLGDKLVWNAKRLQAFPVLGRWYNPDDSSLLYSMQAHLRGHLHGTKKFNPKFDATGAQEPQERTLADQLELIGDRWELFLKKEARPAPLDPQ